jgi:hypothetical protein
MFSSILLAEQRKQKILLPDEDCGQDVTRHYFTEECAHVFPVDKTMVLYENPLVYRKFQIFTMQNHCTA